MNAHQVKAEAVEHIFRSPVNHRIHYVLAAHRTVGGGLIAACRAVIEGAVLARTVIEVRHCHIEIAFFPEHGVIVYDVHDDAYAVLMQRLDHLLVLVDAHGTVVSVGGIGAFGGVVIERVVAPVELRLVKLCLVNGVVVIGGKELYVSYSKLLEVVCENFGSVLERLAGLGEGEEFAWEAAHCAVVIGKIPDVSFIHNCVGRLASAEFRTRSLAEALGIGCLEVYNHAAQTVRADCLCVGIDDFVGSAVNSDIVCIENTVLIAFHNVYPCAVFRLFHFYAVEPAVVEALAEYVEHHFRRCRRPKAECSAFRCVKRAKRAAVIVFLCEFFGVKNVCHF